MLANFLEPLTIVVAGHLLSLQPQKSEGRGSGLVAGTPHLRLCLCHPSPALADTGRDSRNAPINMTARNPIIMIWKEDSFFPNDRLFMCR